MVFYLHLLLKIVPVLHFQVSSAPIRHYFPEHRHICDKVYPSMPWATYMDRFWPETVMGNAPLRGSLRAALIACSRSCGAVTGRKYHCRLSMSWQTARHRPSWDGHLPLCTFDVIFLTGFPAGGPGVSSAPLSSFKLDS